MKKKNNKKLVSLKKKSKEILSNLKNERSIALDFATKAYSKFDKMIKAVVLFGSSVKNNSLSTSDIDIVILIDDVLIRWDSELIVWYREELGKLIMQNKYIKELHVTTVRLTTWWNDLLKGDPVVINMIRYGDVLIDFGGFFNPLKVLLEQGKIRPTPEAIYTCLSRAPEHLRRSRLAELGAIEGIFWAMVDSAQAALMAYNITPPSPEEISSLIKETFVDTKRIDIKYAIWSRDIYNLHRQIVHGEITDLRGAEIDVWQERMDDFVKEMTRIVKEAIESSS
ncbi:MAG: nucleotidyltransferase domain-containing protein [Candidatus Pacearchaeota archaeon]